MKVLIAEEQDEFAQMMKKILEKNCFSVDLVQKGEEALGALMNSRYDVIILDAILPEMNGLDVLKYLRECKNTTPVLLLKSRAGVEDKVEGLEAGADDYLPRPFSKREFLARVKALARRNTTYAATTLALGNLSLDCNSHEISGDSERIRLSSKEYQLAELFLQHPHFIFSTEHLLQKIWGQETVRSVDVVWTHIGFLRKKLKKLQVNVEIRTVRGVGYYMEEDCV